jgi:hypothetical protein
VPTIAGLRAIVAGVAAAAAALGAAPAAASAQVSGNEADPAGGAAIGEVIIATSAAAVVTAILLAVVVGHRNGRLPQVARVAAFAERSSGLPGWASLPLAFVIGSLLIAVFGMYWDISLHIDEGRDPGPLANPAHYFILAGLFGIMIAGMLAMALPLERPSRTAVRITSSWYAPLGGVLMTGCAAFALAGFPLDDAWHRLFGQDVTLWGPTHLMLIGGASLSTLAAGILLAEALRARGAAPRPPLLRWLRFRQASMAGSLLIGLSTFQAEFDFSVPQFQLISHPILEMIAASIALVTARVWLGRGGALLAVATYLAVRGFLSLMVGPVLGQTTLHFPLYIVEAGLVELVAMRFKDDRPVALGAAAGVAIGTIGLAAEWGWSHVWMTIAWPANLLPEAVVAGLIAAVAGGVLGGAIGRALSSPARELAPTPRWAAIVAGIVLLAVVAYPLPLSQGEKVAAQVTLEDVSPPPNRTVDATIRLDPPDAAEDARWFNATAWQGGGAVVDQLEEVGPGEYRTTEPIPVNGNWKSTVRLHVGRAILGLPIFMPEDEAIPAKAIPAEPSFERAFVRDKKNLQREQKQDVAGWLTTAAYLFVLAIAVGLTAALTVGLARLDRDRARRAAAV